MNALAEAAALRVNAMNRINAVLETLPPDSARRIIRALAMTHHIVVRDLVEEAP